MNDDNFNKFSEKRRNFSFSTFGNRETRGCIPGLLHLQMEVKELIENTDDTMEWADCFLLLLDAADRKGHSIDDLIRFANEKLDINMKRQWEKQPNGVYIHKKVDKSV